MKPITWLNKLRKLIKELVQYQESGQTQHILFLHACRVDLATLNKECAFINNQELFKLYNLVNNWVNNLDVNVGNELAYESVLALGEGFLDKIKEVKKEFK